MPLPTDRSGRSSPSPLAAYTVLGSEGATAIAPIDWVGCPSNIGCQVRPPSAVFHTPPFTAPM